MFGSPAAWKWLIGQPDWIASERREGPRATVMAISAPRPNAQHRRSNPKAMGPLPGGAYYTGLGRHFSA